MLALDEGVNPMLLRRGIEQATERLWAGLRRVARPVEGRDGLKPRRHDRREGGRGDGDAVAEALDRVAPTAS